MAGQTSNTKFKPGESGNPNGRPPKGYSITETVRAMLNEKPEIKHALATKVMEAALKGDIAAQKMIWQYMDGMPKQAVDLTSKGEQVFSGANYIGEHNGQTDTPTA